MSHENIKGKQVRKMKKLNYRKGITKRERKEIETNRCNKKQRGISLE